jgi:RNA polymerase sigma factor (sigma-70 family)
MALPNIDRLSKVLDLPVKTIRDYCNRHKSITFTVARKRARRSYLKEPRARLMTLKDVLPPPEEVAEPKTDENERYEQWRDSPEEQKKELAGQLYGSVLRHAKAVIWLTIHEVQDNLASELAATVIMQLPRFKGEAKFSTWVHRIILNHCYQLIRQRKVAKKRFYVSEDLEDDINLKDSKAEAAFEGVEKALDSGRLEHLIRALPKKDYVLLHCRLDEMTMAETALKLGDSEDAVESRWRRLKTRLKKKISREADGK